MEVLVREANPTDMEGVMYLIHELATYEKAAHEVDIDAAYLSNHGFGRNKCFDCLVATINNEIVGTMIYYPIFSTWKGKCLYLEDFVVSPRYRQKGIGELLFRELHKIALQQGVPKIRWQVLDWNEPAIKFYEKIHANLEREWISCTLDVR